MTLLEFLGSWWGLGSYLLLVVTIFFGPPFFLALEERAERRVTAEWAASEPDPLRSARRRR